MFGNIEEGKIYIFYGKMGSGKTTNAVREVIRFWKRDLPVWVNFPITTLPEKKKKEEGESPIYFEADPEGILSMRDGLYVIDEAYMTLNSREWANLPKAVFTAFTHVRKLNMTVIIIAQSWMRIDKSIREVTSIAREFRGANLFGRMFNFVEYEVDEMGDIVKSEAQEYRTAHGGFSLVRKEVYGAFDTDHLFGEKPPPKTWASAIGYNPRGPLPPPAAPPVAPTIHSMQDPRPREAWSRKEREGHDLREKGFGRTHL